uniref:Uncharacterized protein n=1 Tax=Arundo donax TaxID=35708 RepID=A0A0A9HIJ0_ARUDO
MSHQCKLQARRICYGIMTNSSNIQNLASTLIEMTK